MLPVQAIQFGLEYAKIAPDSIDAVAFSFEPKIRKQHFQVYPLSQTGDWGDKEGEAKFRAALGEVKHNIAQILGVDISNKFHW